MPEETPSLFERIPRGLFGPLGDLYQELYWELLGTLYSYEFEREPFMVVRPVALDIAERSIRNSRVWETRRSELIEALVQEDSPSEGGQHVPDSQVFDEDALVRASARRLISRLERSGWIHFQYRSGQGEIMSFHPYAARILETLLRVARDEQPVFQGLVHSIAALLDARTFAKRPGLSLTEARRHTLELGRELKILERNVHLFTQRLLDAASTAAGVLEEGIDRYEHAILANYHRLKTIDNIYRQRSAILDRLAAIERDEAALESAAATYAAQSSLNRQQAREAVMTDLHAIGSHFELIPDLVAEIDARNARYSGVALRKLRYLLRQDRRTEAQLEVIVGALASGQTTELEFDVYRCELLSDEFLYTPPQKRPKAPPQALRVSSGSDRARLFGEAMAKIQRVAARRRIEEFVRELVGSRSSASIEELRIENDADYVRVLEIFGYGLDGSSSFHLRPEGQRLQNGPYGYPGGRVLPGRKHRDREWTSSKTTQS